MSDYLKDIRLHWQQINWADPTLTAKSLSRKMCGPCPYFNERMSDQQAAEFEIKILKEAGFSKWGGRSPWKPYYQHFLSLMSLLMPKRDITLNLADGVMFFCLSLSRKRKLLNLIGSQSSGKTLATACIAMVCLAVAPLQVSAYIANPFDAAADSTVWGEVMSVFYEMEEAAPWLWPQAKAYEARYIQLIPNIPKAALIELRGVKEVGKFKGMKTVKGVGEPLMLVGIDEVNEIKNQAFITTMSNLVSQDGFISVTSQNFTTEDNMGGIFCTPFPLYPDCPRSYRELDKDRHHFWHSHLNGLTLRFNGLTSPNILSGRTLYPYLFNQENLELQRNSYGEDSPEFYSQVLSFPRTGNAEMSVLSRARIDSSRYRDKEFGFERVEGRVAFCDPSFGGGDNAMYVYVDFGSGVSTSADGKQKERHPLMVFYDGFFKLSVGVNEVVNANWMRRARNVGIDITQFIIGDTLSPEEQVAIQCAEYNLQFQVRPENFGFDYSMRHEIVTSMRDICGKECVPFGYNEGPTGYYLENFKKDSKEQCVDRVSELAFMTADLFLCRQLRGGENIEEGAIQLSRTRYEIKSKRYHVENKRAYKARWSGQSPDARDALMGVVGMAALRGFRVQGTSNSSVGAFGVQPQRNKHLLAARMQRLP